MSLGFNQDWPDSEPIAEPEPEPEAEPEPAGFGDNGGEVIVKALYDYTKDEEDELSFLEGDEIIKLSEPSDEGKYF